MPRLAQARSESLVRDRGITATEENYYADTGRAYSCLSSAPILNSGFVRETILNHSHIYPCGQGADCLWFCESESIPKGLGKSAYLLAGATKARAEQARLLQSQIAG